MWAPYRRHRSLTIKSVVYGPAGAATANYRATTTLTSGHLASLVRQLANCEASTSTCGATASQYAATSQEARLRQLVRPAAVFRCGNQPTVRLRPSANQISMVQQPANYRATTTAMARRPGHQPTIGATMTHRGACHPSSAANCEATTRVFTRHGDEVQQPATRLRQQTKIDTISSCGNQPIVRL
jgi:hypothetical protein